MSMGSRRRTILVGFTSLAAVALIASAAWACTGSAPATSISPKAAEPGAQVTVSGTNYAAAPVEVRWNGVPGPVLATAQGPHFSQAVTLPADAAPGMFYLTVVQRDAAGSVTYKVADTVEVTAPASDAGTAAPSTASATGDLWSGFGTASGPSASGNAATPAPSSGSGNMALGMGLMAVGGVALLGGFALAEVRRRRAIAGE